MWFDLLNARNKIWWTYIMNKKLKFNLLQKIGIYDININERTFSFVSHDFN